MLNKNIIIEKMVDLPSPPIIVQHLYRKIAEQDVSSYQVAKIIETDQAFTARVLRLVNSPFYGFARKIVSVEDAITMLGINAIRQLLLTTSLFSAFKNESEATKIDEFWKHSFGVGIIAKHLLGKSPNEIRNEAFIFGILHDIGRLAFLRMNPTAFHAFYSAKKVVIELEQEKEHFGIDHQELGAMLAQKWNFPSSITSAIAFHHNPAGAQHDKLMVSAVNIADILCHAYGIGDSGNFYLSEFHPEAWQILGISFEHLDVVLRKALNEIDESKKTLGDLTEKPD